MPFFYKYSFSQKSSLLDGILTMRDVDITYAAPMKCLDSLK